MKYKIPMGPTQTLPKPTNKIFGKARDYEGGKGAMSFTRSNSKLILRRPLGSESGGEKKRGISGKGKMNLYHKKTGEKSEGRGLMSCRFALGKKR